MSTRPRRLDPTARREQLLEAARTVVERDGVAACTVDAVAAEAGVTPQLVHKYLGTRASLLQELFRVENERYEAHIRSELARAHGFDDVVRTFVTANFDQLSSTTALGRLRGAPETAAMENERRVTEGRDAQRVLVSALAAAHPVSPELTEFVLRLGSAASIEAGNLAAQRPDRSRDADIESTVSFILAGIRELTTPRTTADGQEAAARMP